MSFSEEQETRLRGQLWVKNISGSTHQLTQYGQYDFGIDEELDILDPTTPNTLMAADYLTAKNMVGRATVGVGPKYTDYELAQKINDGILSIIKDIQPDLSVMRENPAE
jgi:hypothetical protein